MRYRLLLLAIILLCGRTAFAQPQVDRTCDCDIYPITSDCKEKCGLKILTEGSEDDLTENFDLKPSVAEKVVSITERSGKMSVKDFKKDLTTAEFNELKNGYKNWIDRAYTAPAASPPAAIEEE